MRVFWKRMAALATGLFLLFYGEMTVQPAAAEEDPELEELLIELLNTGISIALILSQHLIGCVGSILAHTGTLVSTLFPDLLLLRCLFLLNLLGINRIDQLTRTQVEHQQEQSQTSSNNGKYFAVSYYKNQNSF